MQGKHPNFPWIVDPHGDLEALSFKKAEGRSERSGQMHLCPPKEQGTGSRVAVTEQAGCPGMNAIGLLLLPALQWAGDVPQPQEAPTCM